jgi:hypothetical protein
MSQPGEMRLRFDASEINGLAGRYSYARDEQALIEMRSSVQTAGFLDLDQLKQVALWKSPRVAGHVDKNDAAFVREMTGFALSARSERARIEALTLIDGVQWPTASVILHLFHRDPYPILDFRALWSVNLEVPTPYTFEFWWPYVEFCRATAKASGVDMRTLDRALWQFSKENQRVTAEESGVPEATAMPQAGSEADRIRRFAFDAIVKPKLAAGATEVAVRAGDVHSALRLHNQMPNVCSSIESRKFWGAHGLELVRREGPHRGSNAVYYFRPRDEAAGAALVTRESPQSSTAAAHASGSIARAAPAAGTVYWVSCVGQKRSSSAAAKDLYVSDWFTKARGYVESTGAPWFILSAKYGLVEPETVIEPYELTLNTLPVKERRRWARRVQQQIEDGGSLPSKVVILGGARYREFLEPYLRSAGVEVEVPMEGLRIGEQLSWLSRVASPGPGTRLEDLRRFYALLDELERRLGGKLTLAECHGRMPWPRRGVYVFFEEGEQRSDSGSGPRVVRVGTHALTSGSTSTLWGRLSQHRGVAEHGGGNHRGSIFRLIVGAAIKARDDMGEPRSWGIGTDAAAAGERLGLDAESVKRSEVTLERVVSEHISRMPFLYLAIDDEPGPNSLRGVIERNAIALLSNFGRNPLDSASHAWLGKASDRERIRQSGLWNSNHVDETHSETFLNALERLVAQSASLVGGSR